MNKLFIFGAGFSHALAGLPLSDKLAELIYQQALKISRDQKALRKLSPAYLSIWNYLQGEIKPLIERDRAHGIEILALPGDMQPIDLEYLLTLIDMNIENAYLPRAKGVGLIPIPYLKGFDTNTLKQARQFIQHQISVLVSPACYIGLDNKKLLKILRKLSAGDSVITFNYDMLIEQGLYQLGLWNPTDGYGIGALFGRESIDPKSIFSSNVSLVKLHGSINWQGGGPYLDEPDVIVNVVDFGNKQCYFQGMQVKVNHPVHKATSPAQPLILMPTFLKHFNKSYEIQLLNLAVDAARSAIEVYIIGYSLPSADTIANFIISQINREARIIIVNRGSAEELKDRLSKDYGFDPTRIVYEQSDINTWIDNDFEYREFHHAQERDEIFRRMLEAQPRDRDL